MLKHQLVL